MSAVSHNNQSRIAGYLDTLLVDHSLWDAKLSLAMNPPVRPLDTIAEGKFLLATDSFGCGSKTQKEIIMRANKCGTPVFVATNLLESMVTSKEPTRAEINDIYNTLLDGADGLVLAAETAIGNYPSECIDMVIKVANTI